VARAREEGLREAAAAADALRLETCPINDGSAHGAFAEARDAILAFIPTHEATHG
jgi:predicted xylose isomerase-like sugar epimerase